MIRRDAPTLGFYPGQRFPEPYTGSVLVFTKIIEDLGNIVRESVTDVDVGYNIQENPLQNLRVIRSNQIIPTQPNMPIKFEGHSILSMLPHQDKCVPELEMIQISIS